MASLLQGQWKGDGSDAEGTATWEVSRTGEGDTITLTNTGGSPLNLCYEFLETLPSPPAKYFFQVQILDPKEGASLSVGVVRPSEFLKGYKTKGMFYNGNLTNGSAALKIGYGPYLRKQGDVVVAEYTELEETLQVQFYVNQTLVQPAPAFEIPKVEGSSDNNNIESFLPCLNGEGELKVFVTVTLEQPKPLVSLPPPHALQGDWTLVEAWNLEKNDNNTSMSTSRIWPLEEPLEADSNKQLVLHVEAFDTVFWSFSLKVCNVLFMTRSVVTKEESTLWELVSGGGVCTTLMMPPPPYYNVESKLARALPEWSVLKLNNNNKLEVTSNDGLQVLAQLERCQFNNSNNTGGAVCTSYHNT